MLYGVKKMWKKGGFTLIELLVVIAIIGILAGFLLPAVSSARKRAQASKCINNLHQVMLAIRTYTMDYNESFPSVGSGTTTGRPHLQPLYSRYLSTYDLAKCSATTTTIISWTNADYAYNTGRSNTGVTESDQSDTPVIGDIAMVSGATGTELEAKHTDPKPYNIARHDGSVLNVGLTSGSDWTNATTYLKR